MVGRHYIEQKGRLSAGILSRENDWFLVTVLGNIPMYVRTDDGSVGPCLITDGFWEAWITAWIETELSTAPMTFIDVGANTGYYSFLAARAGATVHAFECNPDYVKMMEASRKLQPNENNIIIHDLALGDRIGSATLTIPRTLQGSATIRDFNLDAYDPHAVTVDMSTLDSVMPFPDAPVLIKIDAEGAEELIWKGSKNFREQVKPTFLIEYTPEAYSDTFLDELQEYGPLRWVNFDGIEQSITVDEIQSQTDWIMLVIRSFETERQLING